MREREKTRLWLVFAFTEERERSPKMGAKRKKAVVSARCPPPPKQHHHRRTNVVRVQKHYAFHPNPRVPFAFHLRDGRRERSETSSFLRVVFPSACESSISKERKRENGGPKAACLLCERAFSSFSLDSNESEILLSRMRNNTERPRGILLRASRDVP